MQLQINNIHIIYPNSKHLVILNITFQFLLVNHSTFKILIFGFSLRLCIYRFLVIAVIMAVLCACSLWRKRRQLCGWGSPHPHSQSGDSAGSCYAPPQYSRCSSFLHAPPPYTEVNISKFYISGGIHITTI